MRAKRRRVQGKGGIRELGVEELIFSLGVESGWSVEKIGNSGIRGFAFFKICDQIEEDEMAWLVLRVGEKRNIYTALVGKH